MSFQAGLVTGSPLMPSLWLDQHPEAQVPGYLGWSGPMACTESKVFRAWIAEFMTALLNDYAIDGIIWDEPKSEGLVSAHPETISKFGASPTRQNMEDGFISFLSELTAHCRSIRPDLTITLFNSAKSTEYFTSNSVRIPGLDYAGYDGNLCRQSFFHEKPKWHKYRLESVYDRTLAECRAAKVGTFALVENMLIPREAIPEYRDNLAAFLKKLRFDHLALYYYAHNNEDPETVHKITRDLMQKNL